MCPSSSPKNTRLKYQQHPPLIEAHLASVLPDEGAGRQVVCSHHGPRLVHGQQRLGLQLHRAVAALVASPAMLNSCLNNQNNLQ